MTTEICKIDAFSLERAKKIIESGGAVAFPTETVYGLGANAFSTEAVNGIFTIKGRPNNNPLIVHVHRDYDISALVDEIPDYAKKLAKAYLPGPLTMVYKSKGKVSPSVSCGLDTLAVRVPSHEGAQRFLRCVGLPIAAPSANISKHVSPTSAEHVLGDLNGRIELILDGGKCEGGIESTVLDCTGEVPVILRSGLVTRQMIANVAGDCGVYTYIKGERARSPGLMYKHYSPNCETALFSEGELEKALSRYDERAKAGKRVVIICGTEAVRLLGERQNIPLGKTPSEMAKNLYSALREAEKQFDVAIALVPENDGGIMEGVINRLSKACAGEE